MPASIIAADFQKHMVWKRYISHAMYLNQALKLYNACQIKQSFVNTKKKTKISLTFLVSSPLKCIVIVLGMWPFGTCSDSSWSLACNQCRKLYEYKNLAKISAEHNCIATQTSWNFKNFDALSWGMSFPFVQFVLHCSAGQSNRGIYIRAVTSCHT